MTWTLLQHTCSFDSSGANLSSISLLFPSAVSANSLLVAYSCIGDSTITSNVVTDTVNSGWTKGITYGDANTGERQEIWFCSASAAGSDTVTSNWLANRTFSGLYIAEFSGNATVNPQDGSGGTATTATNVTTLSVNQTVSNPGDLIVVGGQFFNGGHNATPISPALLIDIDPAKEAWLQYMVSVGGGSVSSGATFTTDIASLVGLAFSAAAGGGTSQLFFSQLWPHPKSTNKTVYGQLWPRA